MEIGKNYCCRPADLPRAGFGILVIIGDRRWRAARARAGAAGAGGKGARVRGLLPFHINLLATWHSTTTHTVSNTTESESIYFFDMVWEIFDIA